MPNVAGALPVEQAPCPPLHIEGPSCWCLPLITFVLCSCDDPGTHVLEEWDRPQLWR